MGTETRSELQFNLVKTWEERWEFLERAWLTHLHFDAEKRADTNVEWAFWGQPLEKQKDQLSFGGKDVHQGATVCQGRGDWEQGMRPLPTGKSVSHLKYCNKTLKVLLCCNAVTHLPAVLRFCLLFLLSLYTRSPSRVAQEPFHLYYRPALEICPGGVGWAVVTLGCGARQVHVWRETFLILAIVTLWEMSRIDGEWVAQMAVWTGCRICNIISGPKSSSDFSLENSMSGMENLK